MGADSNATLAQSATLSGSITALRSRRGTVQIWPQMFLWRTPGRYITSQIGADSDSDLAHSAIVYGFGATSLRRRCNVYTWVFNTWVFNTWVF